MLPALLLAYPEAFALTSSLLAFFGFKKLYDKNKDNFSNLFGNNDNDVINIRDGWSDDTKSTIPASLVGDIDVIGKDDGVVKVGSGDNDVSNDNVNLDEISKIGEIALQKLLNLSKNNIGSIPDISSSIDTLSIPLPKVDEDIGDIDTNNLLGLLKANNLALQKVINDNFVGLLQVLGVISNSLSSIAVSNSITLPKIANEVSLLRDAINNLGLAIISLAERPVVVRNVVDTPQVKVENKVETPSVNFDLNSLVDVLGEKLGIIAQAKELEKEHYEFMKTPRSYNIEDIANFVPDISPREAIALSNLVNSHLLSQEATLSAEDLELDDYDIDFNEVIAKLFNFEGISKDIEKFKGGNDE